MSSAARTEPLQLENLACRYGTIAAPSSDNVITRSLRLYGEWAEHELHVLRSFVSTRSLVVDVGANIGTHALAFSRWVPAGQVIAIEAQPVISEVLRYNCRNNFCSNVKVVNAICTEYSGSRTLFIDYTNKDNLGAVSFVDLRRSAIQALIHWFQCTRGHSIVTVPAIRLDDLFMNEMVTLIKLDIEGMELDALRGARETIARCRPVIYFEQNSAARLPDTYDFLTTAAYRLFWLETHPYNKNNFRGFKENIWWRTETGILALPHSSYSQIPWIEVRRNDSPPSLLNAQEGIAVDSLADNIRDDRRHDTVSAT